MVHIRICVTSIPNVNCVFCFRIDEVILGRMKTDARLGGCSSHFLRLAAAKLISSPRALTELCMTHSTYHTKRYKTGLT